MSKINITKLDIKSFFPHLQALTKVDLWVTDPPYPFKNQNGTGRMKFEDNKDEMYTRMTYSDLEWCYGEMFSNSNSGAGCYVFANRDGLFHTKDSLEKSGWIFRNILVWDKKAPGLGYHWRNQVEYIVYCTKGATKKYVTSLPNIFHEKKPTGLSAKPPKIWETIMERQLKDGEVVCDPFAGSDPLSISLNNNQNLMQKVGSSYSNIFP
jgi:site-specific DNA-methyltransferase (adenine-specific)